MAKLHITKSLHAENQMHKSCKKTNIFDKLDNVLGNYADGNAKKDDVINVALKVNAYLLQHPHPHDVVRDTCDKRK